MKKKGNCAFTLVELIAVVAILSILLCIAVPNMMNYINAAHEATAQTEARICVDAVQRWPGSQQFRRAVKGLYIRWAEGSQNRLCGGGSGHRPPAGPEI